MSREIRLDLATLSDRTERTPQGFLKVSGRLTRTGVLSYVRADGSTFRELRHPDEVFRDDSLASLRLAPVTDRHPAGLITPGNVRQLQIGLVADVRRDGRFVTGDLVVQDQTVIDKVLRRDARELSAGYTCQIDATAGEFGGERFDGIQREIVYNHLALGPRDWGRAGPDVALHLDGIDTEIHPLIGVELRVDHARLVPEVGARPSIDPDDPLDRLLPSALEGPSTMTTKTIRIDGLDFEVPTQAAQAMEQALASRDAKLVTETARADAAEGERDAAKTELNETKTKLDAATDPKALSSAVTARVELETKARNVLGAEEKFDGKSDREIKIAALTKHDESFRADDRSDDYIDARFDVVVETAQERTDDRERVPSTIMHNRVPESVRLDGTPPEPRIDSADAARLRAEDDARDASTKNLRVSYKSN